MAAAPFRAPEVYRFLAPVDDPLRAFWDAVLARGVEDAVDRAVTRYLPAGGKVLDLGCGAGVNLARLQRLGIPQSQYVGVDLTPEMLEVARQKFGHLPNAAFFQLDLRREPLPAGTFDRVISTWVFSHLGERAAEVLAKARERLKPDGHMVLLMFREAGSWLDPVMNALSRPFEVKPVPREIYLSLPDRLELRRLACGTATLVVLRNNLRWS